MNLSLLAQETTFLDDGHVTLGDVLLAGVRAVVSFVVLLVAVMLMVWFERKVVARLQNRIGPNVAGPKGLLQTMADGMKLFFKEDLIPKKSERYIFQLAPYLALVPAFITFAIVPVAGMFSNGHDGSTTVADKVFYWQVSDPPIGILLFLAMSSIALYGIMLAGWSSGSKYPLMGAVRASAQAISYEAALGLALAAVLLVSRSLSTHDIVSVQAAGVHRWNLVTTGIVPFVVFLIAGTAELNRPPFDLVEAEQELVGGFHTEYSGFRFALFFLAEFMNTVTMGAIIITLFFGGPAPLFDGWVIEPLGALNGLFWFLAKLLPFLFIYVWFRATLPRFRYDQLMSLGWKVLIPISLGWLLMLAGIRSARARTMTFTDSATVDVVIVVGVGVVVAGLAYALLRAAIDGARQERLDEVGLETVSVVDAVSTTAREDLH